MLLAVRDKKVISLEAEIAERRKMLLNKYSQLKATAKDNEFLEGIVQDYGAYYAYFVKQKQDQISSLREIHDYFNTITQNMKLTERALKDAKFEQNRILGELNKIKGELDQVIDEDAENTATATENVSVSSEHDEDDEYDEDIERHAGLGSFFEEAGVEETKHGETEPLPVAMPVVSSGCSHLRKEPCPNKSGCIWVTGKGCKTVVPRQSTGCARSPRALCVENDKCDWIKNKGCRVKKRFPEGV